MGHAKALLALLTVSALQICAQSSEGDSEWRYFSCVKVCEKNGCIVLGTPPRELHCDTACPEHNNETVPLDLRLTRWNCTDDCKYKCMMGKETLKAEERTKLQAEGKVVPAELLVQKYHGKWPFTRVLGMQEAASVLFSAANLVAQLLCLRALQRYIRGRESDAADKYEEGLVAAGKVTRQQVEERRQFVLAAPHRYRRGPKYAFAWLWRAYARLHVTAWASSMLFHTRDTWLTERVDYMAALAVVTFGLVAGMARANRAHLLIEFLPLCIPVSIPLFMHVKYMLFTKFDYDWNTKVCIYASVFQTAVWMGWAWGSRHPARKLLLAFFALLYGVMLLEVLDFPPLLGLVDAHACWHAATALLVPLFYRFLHADVDLVVGEQLEASLEQVRGAAKAAPGARSPGGGDGAAADGGSEPEGAGARRARKRRD